MVWCAYTTYAASNLSLRNKVTAFFVLMFSNGHVMHIIYGHLPRHSDERPKRCELPPQSQWQHLSSPVLTIKLLTASTNSQRVRKPNREEIEVTMIGENSKQKGKQRQ